MAGAGNAVTGFREAGESDRNLRGPLSARDPTCTKGDASVGIVQAEEFTGHQDFRCVHEFCRLFSSDPPSTVETIHEPVRTTMAAGAKRMLRRWPSAGMQSADPGGLRHKVERSRIGRRSDRSCERRAGASATPVAVSRRRTAEAGLTCNLVIAV
ncbi:MAG: hypothetical protein D6757_06510 [Alphaproteobacteria bacterium]|nr:MAG: hypothetical protein D6757_06510 [Alphaproteobacteria bacterium]